MPALGCPRCTARLDKQADGKYSCSACSVQYPVLPCANTNVAFLWPEPGHALLDWRNRYNAMLADIEQQQQALSSSLNPPPDQAALPTTTQSRLQHLQEAYQRYEQEVKELLQPLHTGDAYAKETHLALQTRLPSHHGVLSYAQNIHRDWCWGDDAPSHENKEVITHLMSVLEQNHVVSNDMNILVLGSGAGRLAYDLHRALAADSTWALDSNPLLSIVAARLSNGDDCDLTEFPLAPITATDTAVHRRLKSPGAITNFHSVCADALHLPFPAEQFDLVVTPWLLDVIDASVTTLLQNISRMLTSGGHWLQHGSVAFDGALPQHRLTAEELAELSTTCGYEILTTVDTELPYLQSPASRQRRTEKTYTQLAVRSSAALSVAVDHQHLPAWIADAQQVVPLTPAFQAQITTVRVHAFIISLVDGKRSIADMARILEEQRLMPAAEAAQAIRGFLTTMYEEAVHRDGFAND